MKRVAQEKAGEFDELMQTSPEQLWWSDLEDVVVALDELDAKRLAAHEKSQRLAQMKKDAAGKKKISKKGAVVVEDEEMDLAEDLDDDEEKPKKKKGAEVKRSLPVLMPLDLK